MQEEEVFRCPFEEKGRRDGTIIEVALNEEKGSRLSAIKTAYAKLHAGPQSLAIRFTLPRLVLKACSSNLELRSAVLPYQAELLAVDLDMQLEPFMSHQQARLNQTELRAMAKREPKKAITAQAFTQLMQEISGLIPADVYELSVWLCQALTLLREESPDDPTLVVSTSTIPGKPIIVLRIEEGAVGYWLFESCLNDPARNKTTFGIVKSPFYPETFGRYSRNVEIVVNRDVDVRTLSDEMRRSIRYRANVVHATHGVRIKDLHETQQPLGVWVPEFV